MRTVPIRYRGRGSTSPRLCPRCSSAWPELTGLRRPARRHPICRSFAPAPHPPRARHGHSPTCVAERDASAHLYLLTLLYPRLSTVARRSPIAASRARSPLFRRQRAMDDENEDGAFDAAAIELPGRRERRATTSCSTSRSSTPRFRSGRRRSWTNVLKESRSSTTKPPRRTCRIQVHWCTPLLAAAV